MTDLISEAQQIDLTTADRLLELGKLYRDCGDYITAIDKLKVAAPIYLKLKKVDQFLECQNLLLRLYAEREQTEDIIKTKELLQDLVLKEGFELTAKTYYTLASCAGLKNQHDVALEYLNKSLNLALSKDLKNDICYAINGLAMVYFFQGKEQEAIKQVNNLRIFMQVLDLPEVRISSTVLNALLQARAKNFDQAIELMWQAYETIRTQKLMIRYMDILHQMAEVYLMAGNKDMARFYLQLVDKSIDPKNSVRLSRTVKKALLDMGADSKSKYDLILDLQHNSVQEKKIGKIDFKNQFILLDLLKLFVKHQGEVYSKEFLVETVWKQKYNPEVHDNKIYVTIKRLRKLIEPDYDKPKYIFRAKNGYYMNKNAKVHLDFRDEGTRRE